MNEWSDSPQVEALDASWWDAAVDRMLDLILSDESDEVPPEGEVEKKAGETESPRSVVV